MNTKTQGTYGQALVKLDCIRRGYIVSTPEGDNAPYDFVVDRTGQLDRVQVKLRSPRNGKIEVELYTVQYDPIVDGNNRSKRKQYTAKMVDIIAVVDPHTELIYFIPMKEVDGQMTLVLRLIPSKNNQRKGVRLAENYMDY